MLFCHNDADKWGFSFIFELLIPNGGYEVLLYKYCRDNDFTINTLSTGQMWFAKPATFNDPFDGFLDLPADKEVQRLRQHINHHTRVGNPYGDRDYGFSMQETVEQVGESRVLSHLTQESEYREIERNVRSRGVLSLTEDYHNILMWSHYANNHEGICIILNIDLENLPENIEHGHINYIPAERPVFIESDSLDTRRACRKILTTKFIDWAYEKEQRLFTTYNLDDGVDGQLIQLPDAIAGVHIGIKTKEEYVERIKSLVSEDKIFYMSHSYYKFELQAYQSR